MNLAIQEKRSKRIGVIFSILFHALLILLFIYLKFFTPPLETTEEGLLINFGTTETGIGDIQPEQQNEIVQLVTPPPTPTPEPTPEKQEEKVVTQDVEEAPVVEKKKEETKKIEALKPKVEKKVEKKVEEKPREEPKKVVNTNLLYKGKQKTDAKSEGVKSGTGDQGAINGDPNAKNHEGDKSYGLGDEGIGFDLSGRKMLRKPTINDKSQEYGKVAVSIKVDRNGKVVSAKYTQKGSNTTSQYLISLAEKAAMEAKFNSDATAAEEQWGTITFTFKVK